MSAVAVQTERRQCVRHPVDLSVNVAPTIGGGLARWSGRVCDLSRRGLNLRAERRFEKNTPLSIRIEDADGDEMLSLFGHVVYVNSDANGRWSMGCRFNKELSERDFEELVKT